MERAIDRCECPIEQEVLDPHVVVEILDVPEPLRGTRRVGVQGWRTMRR